MTFDDLVEAGVAKIEEDNSNHPHATNRIYLLMHGHWTPGWWIHTSGFYADRWGLDRCSEHAIQEYETYLQQRFKS